MKRLWIAVALLAAMCGATLVNAYYCQQLADSLSGRLNSHFYLHVVMRHSDTDQILRTFQSVLQYLELQELDQYAAANADLAAQIQLLAEMEQASLVNVL